ncbi:MAG: hypothetical protein IPL58_16420 [Betaproteobacteria bacterium]|uniref:Uncharacterized protein n=1 Tax=Candidatus Proximibacter danicus TaxID=2954365 RepID=A0A9D7K2W4_9PROT|nr:hypothetical protein [Candidatus Proximibacter danicus]
MTDAELEEIGYAEVLHRFERGDYHDPAELKTVKRWIGDKDRERKFLADCERASISAALEANRAARRAGLMAFLALLISTISAREQIIAFVEAVLRSFSR